jgi:tRNA dimethylallyltransferase
VCSADLVPGDVTGDVPLWATCWFLTGPTAGGKTEAALALAEHLGAEIVSMDSMALYRGMDIGTAKPTAAQRSRVPHHLIDVLDPDQEFSVAQYLSAAAEVVADIRRRGRQALFVGGTPLYLKALLRGIFRGPPPDWAFRSRMSEWAARHGPEVLHRHLQSVDPATAARLHPHDVRRVIRALEVFEKTGRSLAQQQEHFARPVPRQQCRVYLLDWPPELLRPRIERRVEAMFAAGLVEETRQLQARWNLGRTARQAVGYREVLEHLHGVRGLRETIALVTTRTAQFAKRQRTWFRSLSECRAVPMDESLSAADVARRILRDAAAT